MKPNKTINIDLALSDPKLLGMFVQGESWRAWRCLWRASMALPPVPGDVELFTLCTGRKEWPTVPAPELWIVVSRRGGKSMNVGLRTAYQGAFCQYSQLAPGEYATVPIISPTRIQSGIVKGYVSSFFSQNPLLSKLVLNETSHEIVLSNRTRIIVLTSDFRSIRGFTCPLVILEEASFFQSEGSLSDAEVVRAVRPSLSTLGGTLCVISSPFGKSGAVWEAYNKHYGVEGDPVLVWLADSLTMNPTLDRNIIQRAIEEDPEAALAEYQGQFRSDVTSYISPEIIDACTTRGCREHQPLSTVVYEAFADMAGGSGKDSATLGIAHSENGRAVLDCIREVRPPFSPDEVVRQFADTLKAYRCDRVHGDRYAGDWPSERFSKHGIIYEPESRSKSEIYIEALPLFNSGAVELLDLDVLKRQLCGLERRNHQGGRQSVDHRGRSNDDVANSACGAFVRAFERKLLFGNLTRAEWRVEECLNLN